MRKKLNKQLDLYLSQATELVPKDAQVKALIGPHAGYRFSGPNAAWGYKNL